jgi:hypothetical protein
VQKAYLDDEQRDDGEDDASGLFELPNCIIFTSLRWFEGSWLPPRGVAAILSVEVKPWLMPTSAVPGC